MGQSIQTTLIGHTLNSVGIRVGSLRGRILRKVFKVDFCDSPHCWSWGIGFDCIHEAKSPSLGQLLKSEIMVFMGWKTSS